MKDKHTLYMADDHQIVIDAILGELEDSADHLHCLGTANSGKQLLELLQQRVVDLVILDINMPEPNGLELLKIIRRDYRRTKVLIFTMHDDLAHIVSLFREGANGYILKNNGAKYVLEAVDTILNGHNFIPPEISGKVFSALESSELSLNDNTEKKLIKSITADESELLGYLSLGMLTKHIAYKMCLSEKTIEGKLKKLRDKVGVEKSTELIRFALENGFALDRPNDK